MVKSPLAQAEARILALEAEVERLSALRSAELRQVDSLVRETDDLRELLGLWKKRAQEDQEKADALRQEYSGLDAINRNCNRELEQLRQERDYLITNINAALHPDGNGPVAPSPCDLVGYLKHDLKELSQERDRMATALAKVEKARDDWKATLDMYANAWVRELGPFRICKRHEIDALVISTRMLVGTVRGRSLAVTENTTIRVLLLALAACQLSTGTQDYRQQRALAPILRHASGSDLSPPLRLSIQETRRMTGEVRP